MFRDILKDNSSKPFLLAMLVMAAGTASGVGSARADDAAKDAPQQVAANVTSGGNTTVSADNGAVGGDRVESVTVTAERRSENAQQVPQAITAITGQAVTALDLTSSSDLGRLVPNFSSQSSTGRGAKPRWFIRGMGSNSPSANLESPVGVYQDEVYIGLPAAQNFPLYDLARVEVLRGPQGTLYGKNTTGGAVSFISKAPSFDDSDNYAKVGLSSYGGQIAQAGYGGTVIDGVIATRAAFSFERGAAYIPNLYTGSSIPDQTDFAGRLQFLARVNEDIDYNLNLHVRSLVGSLQPDYPIGINARGADNNGFIPSYGTNPKVGDPLYSGQIDSNQRTYGATGTGHWNNIVGDLSLTSITNFDWTTTYSRTGAGAPPVGTPDQSLALANTSYHQVSQEVRLASPGDDRFSWLVGFNAFYDYFNVSAASSTIAPVSRTSYSRTNLLQHNDSYAGFASAKYRFTDDLSLTVGARDTFDTKNVRETTVQGGARGSVLFNNIGDPFPSSSVSSPLTSYALNAGHTWNELTWDATPEYQISDNLRVYVRGARGFRAGNFNPSIITVGVPQPVIPQTNPEVLTSIEGGVKSEWFDDRLIFNASAFHYQLKNIQLNVQQPNPLGLANATGAVDQNAASGWDEGLEFEIKARPIENLSVSLNSSFLATRYKSFLTYQGTAAVNASGNQFYRSPKYTVDGDIDYVIPLGTLGSLDLNTDWSYRSRIYFNAVVQNDPFQQAPGYALGNVHVGYTTPNGKFTFTLYSENILNQTYDIVSKAPNNGAYAFDLGVPRISGGTLTVNF